MNNLEKAKKFARLLGNPKAAAAMIAKAEAEEKAAATGVPVPEVAPLTAPQGFDAVPLEQRGEVLVGPCPACRKVGKDTAGDNLFVYPSGAYGCYANQGEDGHEHRREIFALLKLRPGQMPLSKRIDTSAQKEAVKAAAAKLWASVKAQYRGSLKDLGESQDLPAERYDEFLEYVGMFKDGDRIWAGKMFDSTEEFPRHTMVVGQDDPAQLWAAVEWDRCDLASGVHWTHDAEGRGKRWVAGCRFVVVEHDKEDMAGQIALIRYAQSLGGNLRLVLRTGGKGIHGWFDAASLSAVAINTLISIGADPNPIRRASTRLPGGRRSDTGALQDIVWLAPSTGGSSK